MKRRRIVISVDDEMYEQLKNIADQNHISLSEAGRRGLQAALNGSLSKTNLDFVSKIIREQLRAVMQPSVERLAALSAKTCVQAAAAAYLTAETISRFVPDEMQEDMISVYEQARKKAVVYVKKRNAEDFQDTNE